MPKATLNLGILAHVDAGKTTLTERLLYSAGVIDTLGSVDDGTTQTDTLALERQRGITIRSAVVSFAIAGTAVNLIDTPGHPDFIAEVDRVLSLLDGAVLVISAVEGVQPQTRVLMRALRRLRVPTLVFVNKVDRAGADPGRVLGELTSRLGIRAAAMGSVVDPGARQARVIGYDTGPVAVRDALISELTERDDRLLQAYVRDEHTVTDCQLWMATRAQTRAMVVHPVFFGSAVTGAGIAQLEGGIAGLLPSPAADPQGPLSALVFKIDRGDAGEKVAYVRMFAGTLRSRQPVQVQAVAGGRVTAKPTAISVSDAGRWVAGPVLAAGEIGKVWGMTGVRIGDAIGQPPTPAAKHQFAPPTMQAVVVPVRHRDNAALRVALARLAEQDPLISFRADDAGREISLSLYGEIQQEIVGATLAAEFGIEVSFRPATLICVERPVHAGQAIEILNSETNPFHATIGLRIEPGRANSGVQFRLQVPPPTIPMYVFRTANLFAEAMEQYVRRTLAEGRFGWQVTDCIVTMTDSNYSLADGPPSRRGPLSTPTDFRNLTPMVLMRALDQAATVVCEPIMRIALDCPARTATAVHTALGRLGAAVKEQAVRGDLVAIDAILPAASVTDLRRQLPALTGGEGSLESTFDGYRPVGSPAPTRVRTTVDPRDRQAYLTSLTRHGGRQSGQAASSPTPATPPAPPDRSRRDYRGDLPAAGSRQTQPQARRRR